MQHTLTQDDFSKQCWLVLTRMLNGERITMKTAVDSGIGDIRRRVKDLIDFNQIPVRREHAMIDGRKQRHKWYFLDDEDRIKLSARISWQ